MFDVTPYLGFEQDEWIGVDLDGTAAHWNGWVRWNHIGAPIPRMIERMRAWVRIGIKVKIFTARVAFERSTCKVTGQVFTSRMMGIVIADWTSTHVGKPLEATATKDFNMRELWDDRAIGVIANTGMTVADEYEAQLEALRGKP